MNDPGWYHAEGDPQGTHRYWDGELWQGDPVPIQGAGPVGGPANLPHGQRLATAGVRLGARIVDGLITAIPFIIAAITVIDWDETEITFAPGIGWTLAALVWGAVYEIGFIAALGATPGKMIFGLRVVEEGNNASPPAPAVAAKRWVPSLAGMVPGVGFLLQLGVAVMSGVWIGSDPLNRSVFDKVGGTYVVVK